MTEKWVLCPICGGKTRQKMREDTEAKNLIVILSILVDTFFARISIPKLQHPSPVFMAGNIIPCLLQTSGGWRRKKRLPLRGIRFPLSGGGFPFPAPWPVCAGEPVLLQGSWQFPEYVSRDRHPAFPLWLPLSTHT